MAALLGRHLYCRRSEWPFAAAPALLDDCIIGFSAFRGPHMQQAAARLYVLPAGCLQHGGTLVELFIGRLYFTPWGVKGSLPGAPRRRISHVRSLSSLHDHGAFTIT